MIRRAFLALALILLASTTSPAQAPTSPSAPAATPAPNNGRPPAAPVWRCTLPGGAFEVLLRAMTAVSLHEYLIDGGARVYEVNVATNGSFLARFYYLEANTSAVPTTIPGANAALERGQAMLNEALSRTGSEAWKKVVKSYPTSTHAHTVEYRLETKEALQALYDSAAGAFRDQKPAAYVGR